MQHHCPQSPSPPTQSGPSCISFINQPHRAVWSYRAHRLISTPPPCGHAGEPSPPPRPTAPRASHFRFRRVQGDPCPATSRHRPPLLHMAQSRSSATTIRPPSRLCGGRAFPSALPSRGSPCALRCLLANPWEAELRRASKTQLGAPAQSINDRTRTKDDPRSHRGSGQRVDLPVRRGAIRTADSGPAASRDPASTHA
jgi:hypothetical protein